VAFVLGNGSSRTQLNHNSLTSLGTVYACNAIYREFSPHFLIAVDVKMVNEIIASGYHRTHQVWTNPNKGVSSKSNINFFSPHKGWSSGPTALHFACKNGHQEIYIFGFDYKSVNGKFNNVYADTFNYKKSSDAPTFFGNWLSQTEKTIKEFKNVKFFRVMPENSFIPDKLLNLPNLSHINYLEFSRIFPNTIYSGQKE
jgi:ankyrin repeat protein